MTTQYSNPRIQILDSGPRVYRGFTLISPVGASAVQLLDMKGQAVHEWNTYHELACPAQLLPNGNLLCGLKTANGPLADFDGSSGIIHELSWEGETVWEYRDDAIHHHFLRLPTGNTMVMRWVRTPESISKRVKGGIPSTEYQSTMWCDSLREMEPDGSVAWEWLAYEHLYPHLDIICPLCSRKEWTHANALTVNSEGDIIISSMSTNSLMKINRQTGDIDWRWGGLGALAHPHDLHALEGGRIMVLGCGGHAVGFEIGESEVLIVDPTNDKIQWKFKEYVTLDFYSPWHASCQPLPNGNVLICEGDKGRIFEATEDHNLVWQYISPVYNLTTSLGKHNMLFGAYRYGPDYSGLKGNQASVGETEANPNRVKTENTPLKRGEDALKARLSNLGY